MPSEYTGPNRIRMTCTGHSGKYSIAVIEVLDYVQFKGRDLMDLLQLSIESAVRERRITPANATRFVKFYEDGLNG